MEAIDCRTETISSPGRVNRAQREKKPVLPCVNRDGQYLFLAVAADNTFEGRNDMARNSLTSFHSGFGMLGSGDPFLSLHREMNRLFDDLLRGTSLPAEADKVAHRAAPPAATST